MGIVGLVLDDPVSARTRLADMLARCWSSFFGPNGRRACPRLGREVEVRSLRCARHGLARGLAGLSPALRDRPRWAPDYRLAPETKFPGALRHLADHAGPLGLDAGRIAVGGRVPASRALPEWLGVELHPLLGTGR